MKYALFGFGLGVATMNTAIFFFGIHSPEVLIVALLGMIAMIVSAVD